MDLADRLLRWYDEKGREGLPWRDDPKPYHIWISEIMLQQTRVETVRDYYLRFLEKIPDVKALAEVDEDQLLKLWQGLGYYSRAKNLKKAAQRIEKAYQGRIPSEKKDLVQLPGIGAYTAGAISSIAFQKREIAPDGNAYRVAARLSKEDGFLEDRETKNRLEAFLWEHLPEERPGDFNQALMDLGSGICLPKSPPHCRECPISGFCKAYQQSDPLIYPKKKEKKERKREKKTILLIQKGEKILLIRRPDSGLLGGLWALPMAEGHLSPAQVIRKCEEFAGKNPSFTGELKPLGKAVHIFTHLEWHMEGWQIVYPEEGFGEKKEEAVEERKEMGEPFEMADAKKGPIRVWASREELEKKYSIPRAYHAYLLGKMGK